MLQLTCKSKGITMSPTIIAVIRDKCAELTCVSQIFSIDTVLFKRREYIRFVNLAANLEQGQKIGPLLTMIE